MTTWDLSSQMVLGFECIDKTGRRLALGKVVLCREIGTLDFSNPEIIALSVQLTGVPAMFRYVDPLLPDRPVIHRCTDPPRIELLERGDFLDFKVGKAKLCLSDAMQRAITQTVPK